MRKVYVDRLELNGGTIFANSKDPEFILAGTSIRSMGVYHQNKAYQKFADDYDIHVIFDDDIPHLEFYTVPYVEVIAKDSQGGFIVTVGQQSDVQRDAPICYINRYLECLIISENERDFRSNIGLWQDNLKPYDKITVYRSKAEAEMELEFIDLSDSFHYYKFILN